jgi:hypothetical protein
MFSQAIPAWVIMITLTVDWLAMLLNAFVFIGMIRSFLNQQGHTMLFCNLLQTLSTLSICLFAILGKTELLIVNNATTFFYDQSDIMQTNSVIIQTVCVMLLLVSMLPIYLAGLLQIWCVDAILSVKETAFKKLIIYRPIWLFVLGYFPGILTAILFTLEIAVTGKKIYSVNGAVIAPLNTSIVVISIYAISLLITFSACYYSIRSYRHIKANQNTTMQQVKVSGIPGYVVYQVIHMGFFFPIIGFTKTPELLIWLFPSQANLVFGYIGLIMLMIFPFMTIMSNGSNKKVYPFVPLISKPLEKIHFAMAQDSFWNRNTDLESK